LDFFSPATDSQNQNTLTMDQHISLTAKNAEKRHTTGTAHQQQQHSLAAIACTICHHIPITSITISKKLVKFIKMTTIQLTE